MDVAAAARRRIRGVAGRRPGAPASGVPWRARSVRKPAMRQAGAARGGGGGAGLGGEPPPGNIDIIVILV